MPRMTIEIEVDHLDLGRLYFKACDFDLAITHLEKGLLEACERGDWSRWSALLAPLLRMLAERLDRDRIKHWQGEIERLRAQGIFPETSAINYVLGVSATYEGRLQESEELFQKALASAQSEQENGQADFGLAAVASQRREFDEALARLDRLESRLLGSDLIDLRVAIGLLKAVCLRETGRIDDALAILGPLQKLCQIDKNLYMTLNVLFCYAKLYQAKGEWEQSLQYLDLCAHLLREKDLRHLQTEIRRCLEQIREARVARRRLELNEGEKVMLNVPGKGAIDCTHQHLLVQLLKRLTESQGRVLSKEEIVRALWGEDYHPLRHDNKVYVTVRRLRQLLEEDPERPTVILKRPDGYIFNPKIEFVRSTEEITL